MGTPAVGISSGKGSEPTTLLEMGQLREDRQRSTCLFALRTPQYDENRRSDRAKAGSLCERTAIIRHQKGPCLLY